MASSSSNDTPNIPSTPPARRNFLVKFSAIVIGAVVSIFPLIAGMVVLLDPVLKRRNQKAKGDGKLIRVATLDAVPDDGLPRRFTVMDDRVDAWNRYPNEPIGNVYLRRDPGEPTVLAFHATCPHLGCGVALSQREEENIFRCPCHTSSFDLNGEKIIVVGKINPSPRGMDTLEVNEDLLAQSGEIWVRFMNFYTGTHEKIPKA